jgi:hypothetical protein
VATDQAIELCGGDRRSTIRVLILATPELEARMLHGLHSRCQAWEIHALSPGSVSHNEFAEQINPAQGQAGGWRGFLSRWGG